MKKINIKNIVILLWVSLYGCSSSESQQDSPEEWVTESAASWSAESESSGSTTTTTSSSSKDPAWDLKEQLGITMEGENWKGKLHHNPTLVKGKEGSYYIIDLINIRTKKVIYFEAGKYTISDFDRDFGDGLSDFAEKVISILKKENLDYELFIMGSADVLGHLSFSSPVNPAYKYETIDFFKKIENEKSIFISEIGTQKVPNIFRNEHLPNLRASFIKEKISTFFKAAEGNYTESILLEGRVTSNTNVLDRNITIYLYLPKKTIKKIKKNEI